MSVPIDTQSVHFWTEDSPGQNEVCWALYSAGVCHYHSTDFIGEKQAESSRFTGFRASETTEDEPSCSVGFGPTYF